jgi:hypothetical protein
MASRPNLRAANVNSEASFGAGLGVGRTCPLDYCYQPTVFARGADFTADVLYVVGGLYGNLAAIDELEALASTEQASVTFVFNGDFHWFDADRKWFDDVETRLSRYCALRGNVETEISRMRDIGAGCGCAYPPTVDDLTVRRSNQILGALKFVARAPRHAIACRSCRCSSLWRSPVCELASFTAMLKRLLGGAFPLSLSIRQNRFLGSNAFASNRKSMSLRRPTPV